LTFFKNTQTFEVEIIKIVAEKNKLSEKKAYSVGGGRP
jgi:hypothetical protein